MICPGGIHNAPLYNPDGTRKPDVPTGFYSRKYQYIESAPRVPLSLFDLYDGACHCDSALAEWICNDTNALLNSSNSEIRRKGEYRVWFCNNLYDSGGSLITGAQLPRACGGTAPDVMPQGYNPVTGALTAIAEQADTMLDEYQANTSLRVQQITKTGIVLALLILVFGILYKLL